MKRETISLETLTDLRRQARRRLVGSVVLLVIVSVALWNIISGHTPQGLGQDVFVYQNTESDYEDLSGMNEFTPQLLQAEENNPLPNEPMTEAEAPSGEISIPKNKASPVTPTANGSQNIVSRTEKSPVITPAGKKTTEIDPIDILEGRVDPNQLSLDAKRWGASSKQWSVQLAALTDRKKIGQLRHRLNRLGVPSQFSEVETSKGKVIRIRVGPFGDKSQADLMAKKLNRQGMSGILMVQQVRK